MTDTPEQPFKSCATGSKRQDLAKRFTQYLNTRDTEDHAFPVNLNGAWGTGKTFFVDNWKLLVEEQGHIGIKIDAWESDYLDDPLTIIIAEVIDQLSELTRKDGFYEQEKKIVHFAAQLKGSAPKLLKSLLGKLIGDEGSKELLELFESVVGSAMSAKGYKSNLNIGDLGLEATRAHIRHKQFAKDFKREVQKLVEFAQPDTPKKKVFIFIDELDRCRPTYAIEMLETVKHLFDIPNFVFVFSTDTKQLQHSIKAVYGQDFDSHEYLSRFFEQRLTLPEPDFFEFLTAEKIFESEQFKPLPTLPEINTAEELRAAVSLVSEMNQAQLSLRRLKQICMHIEVALQSQELKSNYFSIFHLIGLIIGRALYNDRQGIEASNQYQVCRLAMKEQTQGSQIKISPIVVFSKKSHNLESGSPVKLSELIDQYGSALNHIKKGHPASQFNIDTRNHFVPKIESVKKLKLQPTNFKARLQCIDGEPLSILDEAQLFEIIGNLNTLSDDS